MFDIAPTELLLVALVALVVIGPKDLPRALRLAGRWVGRARGVARQFRSGFDEMVRQAELEEMEKKWATENERIMREHPIDPTGHGDTWHPTIPETGRAGDGEDGTATGAVDPTSGVAMMPLPPPLDDVRAGDETGAMGGETEADRRP